MKKDKTLKNQTVPNYKPLTVKRLVCKNSFKINSISYAESCSLNKPSNRDKNGFYELIFVEKGKIGVKSDIFNGSLEMYHMILITPESPLQISPESEQKPQILRVCFSSDSPKLSLFTVSPVYIPITLQTHIYRALKEYSFIYPPIVCAGDARIKNTNVPFGAEQLLFQDVEYFFIMMIRKIVLTIDYATAPKHPSYHYDELANAIADYIDKHIEEKITNEEICDKFGINKTTLCKIFKDHYGTTLIKYVNQSKIQAAKSLIREGEMNFTQIAEYLSFSSIHYFCKVFIKYERLTPTEYMKIVSYHSTNKNK